MEKYVFGIDLGGTTVKLGLLSVEGELLDKWEIPTNTANGGATILQDIAAALRGKLNEKGIEHTLIVEEGLDHPYPLFPTPEAKEAQQMMIDIINKK